MKKLIALAGIFCFAMQITAQQKQNPEIPSPIIFIYDASGSMWGQIEGKAKMEIASDVLSASVQELPENQQIGLVAYGHRNKSDCRDVETLVSMDNSSKDEVASAVKAIKPLGKTPLAYSATQVIGQLRTSGEKATIILLTDGLETCDGNICDIVKAAKEEGIDFKMHIVGFGLKDSNTSQLQCAAKAGGGQYYDAANAGALGDAMNDVVTETVDKPEGNFGVYAIKNGEPIDALVKAYASGTKNEADGIRTYKDTVFLYLPQEKYDLEVHALENSSVKPLFIEGIQTFNDSTTYQIISFDGAKLEMTTFNNDEGWDTLVKIKSKDGKTVGSTRTYGRPKIIEVDPGVYDIELTALTMKGMNTTHVIENVELQGGETNKLKYTFKTGIAMIGARSGNELVDATVGIADADSKKGVTGARTYTSESSNPRQFILNPGTYQITVRPLGKHSGKEEIFTLTVTQGETIEKIVEF